MKNTNIWNYNTTINIYILFVYPTKSNTEIKHRIIRYILFVYPTKSNTEIKYLFY